VRAELTIEHGDGDIVAALETVFGRHDAVALHASRFAQNSPATSASITYAAYGPTFIVMAWTTPGRLVIFVESLDGRLRRAIEGAWQAIRSAGKQFNLDLKFVVLLDEVTNDEVTVAGVGLAANLQRPELRYTLLSGVATTMWLVIALAVFSATADLVLGAIPAVLAALLAGTVLAKDLRSRRLVWR
jgi:hypothetical protein